MPVGWARMSPRRSSGASHEGGQTGNGHENAEPVNSGSAEWFWLVIGYAATAFLPTLAVGLDAAFFTVLALSFATNSCLTLAVIAVTSTL